MKWGTLVFILSLGLSLPSLAVLGAGESQFENPANFSKLQRKSLKLKSSTLHLYSYDLNGIHITEYADASTQKVFAFTWSGPARPDICQLAGDYCSEMPSLESNAPLVSNGTSSFRARGPSMIRTDHLLITHSGHMRSLRGQFILHEAVPAGMKIESIQ